MARKATANNKASYVEDRDLDDEDYSEVEDRLDAQATLAVAGVATEGRGLSSDELTFA